MQQRADGMVQITERTSPTYEKLDDFIAELQHLAEGLAEVTVDTETEWETTYVTVSGWRMPTAEELKSIEVAEALSLRNARQQLRRLRHNYPSLFNGQGQPLEEDTPDDPDEIPF